MVLHSKFCLWRIATLSARCLELLVVSWLRRTVSQLIICCFILAPTQSPHGQSKIHSTDGVEFDWALHWKDESRCAQSRWIVTSNVAPYTCWQQSLGCTLLLHLASSSSGYWGWILCGCPDLALCPVAINREKMEAMVVAYKSILLGFDWNNCCLTVSVVPKIPSWSDRPTHQDLACSSRGTWSCWSSFPPNLSYHGSTVCISWLCPAPEQKVPFWVQRTVLLAH